MREEYKTIPWAPPNRRNQHQRVVKYLQKNEQVRKTEMENLKNVDCFPEGYGNYTSEFQILNFFFKTDHFSIS